MSRFLPEPVSAPPVKPGEGLRVSFDQQLAELLTEVRANPLWATRILPVVRDRLTPAIYAYYGILRLTVLAHRNAPDEELIQVYAEGFREEKDHAILQPTLFSVQGTHPAQVPGVRPRQSVRTLPD